MGFPGGAALIGVLVVSAAVLITGGTALAWRPRTVPARGRRVAGVAGAAAGVAVTIVTVLVAAALVAAGSIFPGRAVPSATGWWNIALLGVDSRVGHTGETVHVDALAVLSVAPDGSPPVLFTVPRDVEQVPLPLDSPLRMQWTDGVADCGVACQLGSLYLSSSNDQAYAGLVPTGSTPALEAVRDGLRGILGVDIHAVVEVDAAALAAAVDALGGVTVDVEHPVPMTAASDPATATEWLQPGLQTLDGAEAAWFVRARAGSSNTDRMLRQMILLESLRDQTSIPELAVAAPKLAEGLRSGFRTDMSPQMALQAVQWSSGPVIAVPLLDGLDPQDPDWTLVRQRVADATTG